MPARTLSAAINPRTGENVSRLIHAVRVGEACARAGGTQAARDAGFHTRSTVNHEFRPIPQRRVRLTACRGPRRFLYPAKPQGAPP